MQNVMILQTLVCTLYNQREVIFSLLYRRCPALLRAGCNRHTLRSSSGGSAVARQLRGGIIARCDGACVLTAPTHEHTQQRNITVVTVCVDCDVVGHRCRSKEVETPLDHKSAKIRRESRLTISITTAQLRIPKSGANRSCTAQRSTCHNTGQLQGETQGY